MIAPPAPIVAFAHDDTPVRDRKVTINRAERDFAEVFAWAGISTFPNLPSTVVPVGESDGLPTSVQIIGPPFGLYPELPGERVVVEAGFPVSAPVDPDGEAHPLLLPGGRAAAMVHEGPYDVLAQAYERLERWMQDEGLRPASGPWESYLTGPEAEPDPAGWRTQIHWPVA